MASFSVFLGINRFWEGWRHSHSLQPHFRSHSNLQSKAKDPVFDKSLGHSNGFIWRCNPFLQGNLIPLVDFSKTASARTSNSILLHWDPWSPFWSIARTNSNFCLQLSFRLTQKNCFVFLKFLLQYVHLPSCLLEAIVVAFVQCHHHSPGVALAHPFQHVCFRSDVVQEDLNPVYFPSIKSLSSGTGSLSPENSTGHEHICSYTFNTPMNILLLDVSTVVTVLRARWSWQSIYITMTISGQWSVWKIYSIWQFTLQGSWNDMSKI